MSALDDEVRAWQERNPDEPQPAAPPPPHADAPGSTATAAPPPPASSAAPDDDDDEHEKPISPEEAAALFVGLLDFGLSVFVSPKLEFKERQERKLVKLAVPLARKYLPDTSEVVSPEVAFAVGLGAICWKNYTSTPDPAKPDATPGGGGAGANGPSGDPHTTEATVDGRKVAAEVLQ